MKDNFDISGLKKKPKRINSRTKGNSFERKVAGILNTRFDTKEFARSPGSGAFATTHTLPKHLAIHGDLITPEKFKFNFECKKGYNKETLGGCFKENCDLKKFIFQAEKCSKESGRPTIIIWQQDRNLILAIYEFSKFPELKEEIVIYKDYKISKLESILSLNDEYWFNYQEED